jgi:hypothetical protein
VRYAARIGKQAPISDFAADGRRPVGHANDILVENMRRPGRP